MAKAEKAIFLAAILCGCLSAANNPAKIDCAGRTGNEFYRCLSNKAWVERNLSICQTIDEESMKDLCTYDYAGKVDFTACTALKDPFKKDQCLKHAAKLNGLAETCEWTSTPAVKDDCLLETAISTFNSGLCDKIQDFSKKRVCVNSVA